jgi:proteic killer suppression protein
MSEREILAAYPDLEREEIVEALCEGPYPDSMIKTFRHRETAAVFADERVRRWPPDIRRRARRKRLPLDQVTPVEELRAPPGNRLEPLTGDRSGAWSLRINDPWRIGFRFPAPGPLL